MSKCTNPYQRLVKLIQQAIAPKGGVVSESVEVGEDRREIDVLLEAPFGMFRMKVAIEAKKHKAPLDVKIIEQIAAKYRPGDGIQVDKVVIVCPAGYTRKAKKKAENSNIELLTLKEAELADWTGYVSPSTPQTLHLKIPPHIDKIEVIPHIDVDWRKVANDGHIFCTCHGHDKGSVLSAVKSVLEHHVKNDPKIQADIKDEMTKTGGFKRVIHADGYQNRIIRFGGQAYPLHSLRISVSMADAVAPLSFSTYEQSDSLGVKQVFQHGVADIAGRRVEMLLIAGIKSPKIAVNIADLRRRSTAKRATK